MTQNSQIDPSWQPVGSWTGGTVTSVAVAPSDSGDLVALATTRAGLFRSTDGGQSWLHSTQGLTEPSFVAVTLAGSEAQDGLVAYVSTDRARLFASEDGGASWDEVEAWAGLGVATAFAPSPDFAHDHTLLVATDNGVFRTFDAGKSWESSTFGLLDPNVLCMACAPDFADSEIAWVGTADGGFFRSRNAGRAWRESGLGLPDAAVQAIAVAANADGANVLFVGTEENGVYRSDNEGADWSATGDELAGESVNALAAFADDDGEIVLLAGTGSGVYRSDDGGGSWALTIDGDFLALSFSGDGDQLAAAAYLDGVYTSDDGGRCWRQHNDGLTAHAPPLLTNASAQRLFATDVDGLLAGSDDGGVTWQSEDINGEPVLAMTTAGSGPDTELLVATTGGLYRRQIGEGEGENWRQSNLPSESVAFLHASPRFPDDRLLLAGDIAGNLYLSRDGATSWEELEAAWQGETLLQALINQDADSQTQLHAVSIQRNAQGNYDMRVWSSQDLGQSWTSPVVLESESPAVLMAAPSNDVQQSLLLATRHRFIKVYHDPADDQLKAHQHFFEEGTRITGVVASSDYAASRSIFVTTNIGVFFSDNGGEKWVMVGRGLEDQTVVALVPAQSNASDAMLAVTLGGQVWRLEL